MAGMFMLRHSLYREQPFPTYDDCMNTDEVIDYATDGMSDTSALIGFVAGDTPGCSYTGFPAEDPVYEKAIAECYIIKESPSFSEGILLKCIDKQPMFPYLHLSQFQSLDHQQRQGEIDDLIQECRVFPQSLFGSYEEVYSIQKTTTAGEARLPSSRHAGYIVIGFKILDESSKQQSLEKSWLSWSGAREIYKHSPRTWNLRRISLRKNTSTIRSPSRPFAYILLCEFGSILHPSNTLQAMDMCERLRVRNCGHISLYQVHTSYSANVTTARKPISKSLTATKRAAMIRGFSHDVEAPPPSTATEERRARMRFRERSFQYPDEHYTAYQ
ncbi:unnamed protein product [Cylicocyclus nassatus]|uniref:DUF7153 domain-containing protein n=1 Tax=Cylicocyclus nassatus TaxID=53992 RepID=A0AA36DRC7_CYLNA|nr:unnamed protein product [Cylicocyclus nassatus]